MAQTPLLRISIFKPCCFLLLALSLAGPARAAESDAEELKKLEQALALPGWNLTTTLGAGAGYRDNVLLSPTQPSGRGFARGTLEAMLLRLPVRGFDGYVFLSADEIRYFSTAQTDHERTVFLLTEARWQASAAWKFGLPVQAYHVDQVVDVSATQAVLDTAQLKVTGLTFGPTARWNFTPAWWAEAKGTGRSDHFKDDVDGYFESEGLVRLGRSWKNGSEFSLAWASRWRDHDSRPQYALGGRPLTGTHLKFRQNEATAKLELVADEKKQWTAKFAATVEQNRDNGSGYFDFNQRHFVAGLDWRPDPSWEVEFSASVAHYDFRNQLIGIGITPETRHKNDYQASVEVTHQLTAAWSLKASYEWERARSNDDRSQYRLNTVYLGVQWNWDSLGTADPAK
jgi:hypothetical protein